MKPENLLITVEYIRQALDDLIKAPTKTRINPLQFLYLVDEYCLRADFSFFQNPRQFALDELLVSVIRDQYVQLRSLYDLPAPQVGISFATAITVITEDAAVSNPDLLGWTWVYFRYVEDSLHISQQWFCDAVKLDDRTIRRYQNDTINQLMKHLIRLEQKARDIHRKQILSVRLPHQGSIAYLFERERELDIVRNSTIKHIYISGVQGIGKSVFVECFLQEKINNDDLDQILWIESAKNVDYVKFYIQEQLLSENSKVTLAEYLSIRHIAIVLDDCEYLLDEMHQLEAFILEFSNAYIFLISHRFQAVPGCLQINLQELSPIGASALLRQLQLDTEAFEDNQYVWQRVGGNPLAIQLLVQNRTIFDLQVATSLTLDHVFLNIYQSLQQSEQLAWLILALLHNTVSLSDLSEWESTPVSADNFMGLVRLSIATQTENSRITLASSARHFIEFCYRSTSELQSVLERFVSDLNSVDRTENDLELCIVESALSNNWIQLSEDIYLECARYYSKHGIRRGHFAIWHAILIRYAEDIRSNNVELAIRYGVCERHLGQWVNAHSVFANVIKMAGITGDFGHQGEALLEIAILMRWQGNYRSATEALDHVKVLGESRFAPQFGDRLLIEEIEIALEQNQTDNAWSMVKQLQESELRKQVLIAEICARESIPRFSFETMQNWVTGLLSHDSSSTSVYARLHILMGRISEKQGDNDSAIKHLSIALALLTDQDNDPFALGRTQTNLASLFIQINQLADAQMLLNSAKSIQRQIGDRVGLAASMHNEHTVHRKIVS